MEPCDPAVFELVQRFQSGGFGDLQSELQIAGTKIFRWVQKFAGGVTEEKKRFEAGSSSARDKPMPEARKEEFNDWPQALLSIGTFGIKEPKEEAPPQNQDLSETSEDLDSPDQEIPDFTIEEVNKLQKELTMLLTRKSKLSSVGEEDRINLPLNRFLNCPSSLEVDRTVSSAKMGNAEGGRHDQEDGNLSPNTKIIISKLRDTLLGNRNSVKKKSLSFLIKKVFVCANGFAPPPAPSLRDPIPESRMEKILRGILTKKIYTKSSAQTAATTKKYIQNSSLVENKIEDKEEDERKDEGKWVKTDSDFIVLEI